MHPPAFHPHQMLSDWPDCSIELRCPGCGSIVIAPVKLLIRKRGNQTVWSFLNGLRCKRCGQAPAPVYLCAGPHRQGGHGITPDWTIELATVPKR